MLKFLGNVLKILIFLGGLFLAFGVLVEKMREKIVVVVPQKRACESAVCAVDQCMPY